MQNITIDLPGRPRNVIPLSAVAGAIARWEATERRPNVKPRLMLPAYDAQERRVSHRLLADAQAGRLRVCDAIGIESTAQALIANGIMVAYEDRESTELSALFTTVGLLAAWAAVHGLQFLVTFSGWNDYDGPNGEWVAFYGEPPEWKLLPESQRVVPEGIPPSHSQPLSGPEASQDRQDRRLRACEAAGLRMPAAPVGRLPNGVGAVAAAEGVSRQAFCEDVRAALRRRADDQRDGVTRHRAE